MRIAYNAFKSPMFDTYVLQQTLEAWHPTLGAVVDRISDNKTLLFLFFFFSSLLISGSNRNRGI
jgi:hypothetical protein